MNRQERAVARRDAALAIRFRPTARFSAAYGKALAQPGSWSRRSRPSAGRRRRTAGLAAEIGPKAPFSTSSAALPRARQPIVARWISSRRSLGPVQSGMSYLLTKEPEDGGDLSALGRRPAAPTAACARTWRWTWVFWAGFRRGRAHRQRGNCLRPRPRGQ